MQCYNHQDHNQPRHHLGKNLQVQYDETNSHQQQQQQQQHLLPHDVSQVQFHSGQSDARLFEYQLEFGLLNSPSQLQQQPASRKVSNCSTSSHASSTSSSTSSSHYNCQVSEQPNYLQPSPEVPLASYHTESAKEYEKGQTMGHSYVQDQFHSENQQYQTNLGDTKQQHEQQHYQSCQQQQQPDNQESAQGDGRLYRAGESNQTTSITNLNHQASYPVSFQETQMIELSFNPSEPNAASQPLYHNHHQHVQQQHHQVISGSNFCSANQNGEYRELDGWYSVHTDSRTKLEVAEGQITSYKDCGQDLNNNINNSNNNNNDDNAAGGYRHVEQESCYQGATTNNVQFRSYTGSIQDSSIQQATNSYLGCFDENHQPLQQQQQQQYQQHQHQQQQQQQQDSFQAIAAPSPQQQVRLCPQAEGPAELCQGRRGRPRKRTSMKQSGATGGDKGNGKLWEFIRDLLLNERTNPSFIRWERHEDGVFKFVQSDKVAKMWGERKQNPKMTYEKLSRAMRYYYKSRVLMPVLGRRLVYKFGPNATGWMPQPSQTLMQLQQLEPQRQLLLQHQQHQNHIHHLSNDN